MRYWTKALSQSIITLAILGCKASALHAEPLLTFTWNGSADTFWSNPNNWSPNTGITSDNDLQFGSATRYTSEDTSGVFTMADIQFLTTATSSYNIVADHLTITADGNGNSFPAGVSNPLSGSARPHTITCSGASASLTFNGTTATNGSATGASTNTATQSLTTDTNQVYYVIGDGTTVSELNFLGNSGGGTSGSINGYVTIKNASIMNLTGTGTTEAPIKVFLASLTTEASSEVKIAANNILNIGASRRKRSACRGHLRSRRTHN